MKKNQGQHLQVLPLDFCALFLMIMLVPGRDLHFFCEENYGVADMEFTAAGRPVCLVHILFL